MYYFSVHVLVDDGEYGEFFLKKNAETLCKLYGDNGNSDANDFAAGSCAATIDLNAGNKINKR